MPRFLIWGIFLVAASAFGGQSIKYGNITVSCHLEKLQEPILDSIARWRPIIEATWCAGKPPAAYPIEVFCHPEGTTRDSYAETAKQGRRFPEVTAVNIFLNPSVPDLFEDTLPHELTHALLPACLPEGLLFAHIPAWIGEGIATSSAPNLEKDSKRQLYQQGKVAIIPLMKFFVRDADDKRSSAFYMQAGQFINFLKDKKGGAQKFLQFLAELYRGKEKLTVPLPDRSDYQQAFRKVYETSVDQIETEFSIYLSLKAG